MQQGEVSALAPVLIIDDDEFFRIAIDLVLRERFHVETVVTCATAEEAVEQINYGTHFGLSLVDLNMAGMNNKDLMNTLKAGQPDTRLVVMSASKSRDDIFMALAAGAQGFINKGLGIGEAEVALRQIASGSVYVPPFLSQVGPQDTANEAAPETGVSIAALTPRQLDVLRLLVEGQPNKGIARALGINLSTVKYHLSFIFQIIGASNRVEAAILGAKLLREAE
jgi:DNA-binding NarL/FixJ family response regulator